MLPQLKRKFGNVIGKTHETPKDRKAKYHNWWAFSQ